MSLLEGNNFSYYTMTRQLFRFEPTHFTFPASRGSMGASDEEELARALFQDLSNTSDPDISDILSQELHRQPHNVLKRALLHERNDDGCHLIHIMADRISLDFIKYLVQYAEENEAEEDLGVVNPHTGQNAFHYAVSKNSNSMARHQKINSNSSFGI